MSDDIDIELLGLAEDDPRTKKRSGGRSHG
jgi:hypothetical protein